LVKHWINVDMIAEEVIDGKDIDLIPIVENFALDIGKAPLIILNYYSLFH